MSFHFLMILSLTLSITLSALGALTLRNKSVLTCSLSVLTAIGCVHLICFYSFDDYQLGAFYGLGFIIVIPLIVLISIAATAAINRRGASK